MNEQSSNGVQTPIQNTNINQEPINNQQPMVNQNVSPVAPMANQNVSPVTPMANQNVNPVTPMANQNVNPVTPMANQNVNSVAMNQNVVTNNGVQFQNQNLVNNMMPQQNFNGQPNNIPPKKGLSTGAIIGICAGVIAVVLVIVAVVTVIILNKSNDKTSTTTTTHVTTSKNSDSKTTTTKNAKTTTTSVATTTVSNVTNNGNIDGLNFVLYGKNITYGKTTYDEISSILGYSYYDKSDNDIKSNYYDFQIGHPGTTKETYTTNRSVPSLTVYFENLTESTIKFKDCSFYRFDLEADSYTNGKTFVDGGGVSFDLGSGINQDITEDKALSILGEAYNVYNSDTYNLKEYTWKTSDYQIKLGFNQGGLYKVSYENYSISRG